MRCIKKQHTLFIFKYLSDMVENGKDFFSL
jgi:hypothetical protein